MTYLHCQIWTQIQTRIWTPNPMATLYYAEVFTARSQIRNLILTANYRNGLGIRVRTRVRLLHWTIILTNDFYVILIGKFGTDDLLLQWIQRLSWIRFPWWWDTFDCSLVSCRWCWRWHLFVDHAHQGVARLLGAECRAGLGTLLVLWLRGFLLGWKSETKQWHKWNDD